MSEFTIDSSKSLNLDEVRALGFILRRDVLKHHIKDKGLNKSEPAKPKHWLITEYAYNGDRGRIRELLKNRHDASFLELEFDKCDDLLGMYALDHAEFVEAKEKYESLFKAWNTLFFIKG